MDIKVDRTKLLREQIESLEVLDGQLRQTLLDLCNTERGKEIQVEYGTALIKDSSDEVFKVSNNASFGLSYSFVLVDAVTSILKAYFKENDIPGTKLLVNLTFSPKKILPTAEDRNGSEDRKEQKEETKTFIPSEPKYSFDKIVLPERVFSDLMNAVKIIEYRDLIFNQWGYGEIEPYARCVINMYGPAGTGKTMCAHAIAKRVNKKLLALNYSEIESKYLGEAAKNLAAAFDTALETDSVIFFDEADSFLGKRVQNVTQSSDQALNSLRSQMLILLEKFDGIVIFATNLVSNFDEAFMSRIQKHIRFELPNADQRAAIIEKQIPPRLPLKHPFTDGDFKKIGECGEGLSGREIKNAVFELLLERAGNEEVAIFSPEDFANALTAKVESNKRIEEEKNRHIKDRIMKKMTEQSVNKDNS